MFTTEIEARFLDIDPALIRQTLRDAGAELVSSECLMRREPFDFADGNLGKKGGWVRLRDEGERITLSYKQEDSHSLTGMKEASVDVSSFEHARALLECIGLRSKSFQETKRECWKLNGTEVTIDTWPWIPTIMEIEGPDEASVKQVAQLLDLDWSQARHGGIDHVYTHYFDITKEEFLTVKSITFQEGPPTWMEKKRR